VNAFEFANRSFKDCSKNNFLNLTPNNATRRLANSLTTAKLQSSCDKLTKEYGELIDFTLVEILCDNYRIIYRYKAKYEKTNDFIEFRISTNMQNKFAGIFWKDKWFDEFYEDNESSKK
jgi:hypothetical protein